MENEPRLMTRGEFLRYASITGVAFFATGKAIESGYHEPAVTNDNSQEGDLPKYELADTIKEAIGYNALNTAAALLATQVFNLPIGNASHNSPNKNNQAFIERISHEGGKKSFMILMGLTFWSIFDHYLALSVREEFFFRFLPSLLTRDRSRNPRWDFGIPSSLLFAACHNVIKDEQTKRWSFDTQTIPASQFVSGLYFWKLQRERGLVHNIAAHSTVNATASPLGFIEVIAFYGIKGLVKKLRRNDSSNPSEN